MIRRFGPHRDEVGDVRGQCGQSRISGFGFRAAYIFHGIPAVSS